MVSSSFFVFCFTLNHIFKLSARIGEVKRVTKETNVSVKINLDGTGVADSSTGIPFLDHMLDVSVLSFFLASIVFCNDLNLPLEESLARQFQ